MYVRGAGSLLNRCRAVLLRTHSLRASFRGNNCKDFFRHSEGAKRPKNPLVGSARVTTTASPVLLSFSRFATPASDANPAQRIAAEKEEQGSGRSFRREAEAESSGLCDDAIPPLVPPG